MPGPQPGALPPLPRPPPVTEATVNPTLPADELIGTELARLLPLIPEYLWEGLFTTATYGGLAHATALLSENLEAPLMQQLLTLRAAEAPGEQYRAAINDWSLASRITPTISFKSRDFIDEYLATITSQRQLRWALHRLSYGNRITDVTAHNAILHRLNTLLLPQAPGPRPQV